VKSANKKDIINTSIMLKLVHECIAYSSWNESAHVSGFTVQLVVMLREYILSNLISNCHRYGAVLTQRLNLLQMRRNGNGKRSKLTH